MLKDIHLKKDSDLVLTTGPLQGAFKAVIWYSYLIIISLPSFISNSIFWSGAMFKNYISITVRNIKRHKSYSFVNIIGLAIGMAVFVLINHFVQNELSYDKFHKNYNRIYRIVSGDPSEKDSYAGTPAPLGPAMKDTFPEIETFVRISKTRRIVEYNNKKFYETEIFRADNSIFDIFSFPIIKGDPENALNDLNAVVLTD